MASLSVDHVVVSEADGFVDNSIDDAQVVAMDYYPMLFSETVNATAEDVILGNDFFDIESVVQSLSAMRGRAAAEQSFLGTVIGLLFESVG